MASGSTRCLVQLNTNYIRHNETILDEKDSGLRKTAKKNNVKIK